MRTGWLWIAALAALGCESGTEIAGVSQATAVRASNGSVVVTATLDCMLAAGMPRMEGCDADRTRVCVEARWFPRTDAPPTAQAPGSLASAQACQKVASVRGATVQVTLTAGEVPPGAASIVVFSTDQHRARTAPHEVVIAAR